jgi:hypothetical protein
LGTAVTQLWWWFRRDAQISLAKCWPQEGTRCSRRLVKESCASGGLICSSVSAVLETVSRFDPQALARDAQAKLLEKY